MSNLELINFDNYLSSYDYSTFLVRLTDDASLSLHGKSQLSCKARPLCLLYMGKVRNLSEVLSARELNREKLLSSLKKTFVEEWYIHFDDQRLKELLKRYYVKGFDSFCVAITPENKEKLPLYKFVLPKYILPDCSPEKFTKTQLNIGVDHYFETAINFIRGEHGNKCLNKTDFLLLIKKIREIAELQEKGTPLQRDDCNKLNNLSNDLPEDKDITSDLLQYIYDSLIKDLLKNNLISQCQICGDFFEYYRSRKYCSRRYTYKACGKKAQNQRNYKNRKNKLNQNIKNI